MNQPHDRTGDASPTTTPDPNVVDPGELRRGVAALAGHLQMMGVDFFPRADSDSVAAWQADWAKAESAVGPASDSTAGAASGSVAAASGSPVAEESAAPSVSVDASKSADTTGSPIPSSRSAGSRFAGSRFAGTASSNRSTAADRSPYPGDPLEPAARLPVLESLSQTVAQCDRCPVLAGCRTQTVFGEGSPSARFVFFGEGPGADEDRTGRPFVGKAGQLLTKMIEACTLRREEVYIMNTVKCRPPGNRNPEPDEIEHCREFFQRQLEVIQPEYIICLGAVSMKALLDTKQSVGRMRGKLHSYLGSKVLVTYHPAYLLRTPAAKKAAWEDLQFLLADAGIVLPKRS